MLNRIAGEPAWTASGLVHDLRIVALRAGGRHPVRSGLLVLGAGALATLIVCEARTGWLQSRILTSIASRLSYAVEPGPSPSIRFPASGPYDVRLGHAAVPRFEERLTSLGFGVTAQARISPLAARLADLGLYPIYPQKTQAGLRLLDHQGLSLYQARFPERIYPDFESIPPVVIESLLFVENREILDLSASRQNPAIEWARLGKAFLDLGLNKIHGGHPVSGGSTLATQLEKVRHSPEGRTSSLAEKGRQMASASLRAYQDGEDTVEARRRIVRDYLNSLPLAALPGYGEVQGLGDGLWAWFAADFDEVNRLLLDTQAPLGERAVAYRQTLSLLLAIRKPTVYLRRQHHELDARADSYLRLLAGAGAISPELRDAALAVRLEIRERYPGPTASRFADRKAADAVRVELLRLLGIGSLYDLDRLDLSVTTTLDSQAGVAAAAILQQLADPQFAARAGITGYQLLSPGSLDSVIYSFTLYESTPRGNVLRVLADNYDQPLNINEGTKLELGSTAKLRTLVTYLDLVAELHGRYSAVPVAAPPKSPDRLTRWALDYLRTASNRDLPAMLEAAMNRTYSASPGEAFFTGGGLHTFSNFDSKDNGRVMTVREAFQKSVNLVFIRLMRDIVHYHLAPRNLEDLDEAARVPYLRRFADWEGSEFVTRFYGKYAGQPPDGMLATLVRGMRPTPRRLAVSFRSARPEAGLDVFTAFLTADPAARGLSPKVLKEMYEAYGPEKFTLNDRGYLARIHPLELWLLEYLHRHPDAGLPQVLTASEAERQEVYQWLLKSSRRRAQDSRIRTLLEIDAFEKIHRRWQRAGYPFPTLVPSLATSIGSSADNPVALADLLGILVNGGARVRPMRIQEMELAQGTPFETVFGAERPARDQVLPAAVAAKVREELVGVVENGTARRALKSVVLEDGQVVPVGGKTGTGDNRFHMYSAGGSRIGSRAVNRTAAFAFIIGDRFYGTVVAYVPGEEAASYRFTSALPVQVFKQLVPQIRSLMAVPPAA